MKKDEQLEKVFDEYFEGAIPPQGAADDAKKLIAKRKRTKRVWLGAASAAACALLVFAGALGIMLSDFRQTPNLDADGGVVYYTDADLACERISVYEAEKLAPALSFIELFCYADNATVTECAAYSLSGGTALIRAEVSVLAFPCRQDVTVYAELEENAVYEPLKDYFGGSKLTYRDLGYTLTQTEENGETVSLVQTVYGGTKLYFSVKSSNAEAYVSYLRLLAS